MAESALQLAVARVDELRMVWRVRRGPALLSIGDEEAAAIASEGWNDVGADDGEVEEYSNLAHDTFVCG